MAAVMCMWVRDTVVAGATLFVIDTIIVKIASALIMDGAVVRWDTLDVMYGWAC